MEGYHLRQICLLRETQQKEVQRTRMTVGGDHINYPDDCGTPMADMLLVEAHPNSVNSTPGAQYTCFTSTFLSEHANGSAGICQTQN